MSDAIDLKCVSGAGHQWQPVSFRFETEMLTLDATGAIRLSIRQPDIDEGRVYCVCMACRRHTYVATKFAGHYLGGPEK